MTNSENICQIVQLQMSLCLRREEMARADRLRFLKDNPLEHRGIVFRITTVGKTWEYWHRGHNLFCVSVAVCAPLVLLLDSFNGKVTQTAKANTVKLESIYPFLTVNALLRADTFKCKQSCLYLTICTQVDFDLMVWHFCKWIKD